MTHSRRLPALLFALLACASVAHAKDDGHDKDRAAITQNTHAMDAATSNKDADTYLSYTADGFVQIDEKGNEQTAPREQQRASLKALFAKITSISSQSVITDTQFSKEGASVGGVNTLVITLPFQGRLATLTTNSTYRAFWIKSGDSWLMQRFKTLTKQQSAK